MYSVGKENKYLLSNSSSALEVHTDNTLRARRETTENIAEQ
jgi:hypothetical protein